MFGNTFFKLAFQRRFLLQITASALAFVRVPGLVHAAAALSAVSVFAPDRPDDGLTRIRAVSFGGGAATALARVAMYPAPGLSFLRFESAMALTGSEPKAIARALDGVHAVVLLVDENKSAQLSQAVALGRQAKSLGLLTIGVMLAGSSAAQGQTNNAAACKTNPDDFSSSVHSFMRIEGLTGADMTGPVTAVLRSLTHDLACACNEQGSIGVDYDDVVTVLGWPARLSVGSGAASGHDRGRLAAEKALTNAWPESQTRRRIRGLLVMVAGAPGSVRLRESRLAMNTVHAGLSPDAYCIYSAIDSQHAGDDLHVTVLATAA